MDLYLINAATDAKRQTCFGMTEAKRQASKRNDENAARWGGVFCHAGLVCRHHLTRLEMLILT